MGTRDMGIKAMVFYVNGMPARPVQALIDPCLWAIQIKPVELLKNKIPIAIRAKVSKFLGKTTVGVMLTYVDDVLVAATKELSLQVLKNINTRWKCSEATSTIKGDRLVFLSTRVTKVNCVHGNKGFGYQIDQQAYAKDLIDRHGLTEANPVNTC